MEVFVLHILKLNIIAAVIILLVKLLAILFKGQVSARWKYIIWLLITVSLCIPVRLPANFTLVDFKVQRSIQQNEQNSKTTDYAARPGERQQKMEIMSSVNNNTKSQSEVPEQKEFIVHTAGKWLETIAVIFASVWLSVAVLKVTPPKTLELVGIPLRVKPRMMKTSRDKMKLFIGPAKLVIIRAGKLADWN